MAIGYGLGRLAVLAPPLFLVGVIAGGRWQNQVRELVGQPPIESSYTLTSR